MRQHRSQGVIFNCRRRTKSLDVHHIGPQLKLLTGAIVALTLVFLGGRITSAEKEKWFGQGLTAGGWALAYFTAYAAYFLPSVRVIPLLSIESILLISVAGGSLFSAIRDRSEIMSIFSVTLAVASILVSGPSLLSDVSFLIIAVTTSILSNRQSWRKLFACGLVACYLGHLYCSFSTDNLHDHVIASVFLGAIWLVFSVGLGYSVQNSEQARKFTTIISCLNSIAFAGGLVFLNGRGIPETREVLLMSAGSVYLAAARWLRNRNEHQLTAVHSLLGLTLINIAKAMHFSGLTLLVVDIMEIGLLGTIGVSYGLRTFRWFAIVLSCLLFPAWLLGAVPDQGHAWFGVLAFPYFKLGVCATLVMSGLASQLIRSKDALRLPKQYSYFYYIAANLMCMLTISMIVDPNWQALALVVQTVINHRMALKMTDNVFAHCGTLSASIAAFIMYDLNMWNTLTTSFMVLLLYVAHGLFRLVANQHKSDLAVTLQNGYACGANILLMLFIFRQLPAQYVSIAVALEAISLLLIGFFWSDRLFRLSGLAALAILSGKLFLFDFAKFDTLERVISFIVAGIVFLLSSYGYTRWTRVSEENRSGKKDLDGDQIAARNYNDGAKASIRAGHVDET